MIKKHQLIWNSKIIAVILTLFSCIPAHANYLQSHASISLAVKQFVKQQNIPLENAQVTLTSLNKELRLPICDKSLYVSMTPGSKLLGNTTFAVSCKSSTQWKIHVAAHIDGKITALTARHPITRGTVIQEFDLKFVVCWYSQLNHGYYVFAKLLVNMEAK